ncbi:hypothetical protein ACFX19_043169 [Malus domestica]
MEAVPVTSASSAKHMISMMIMSVMMITPAKATTSPPSSLISPATAPAWLPTFLPSDQLKNQVRQGGGGGDECRYEAQASEIAHRDYGIWSPTPYFGRGGMAPIPH